MSDNCTPAAAEHDPALVAIDEQVRLLDADILASTRKIEVDTAVRDRLMALRALLVPQARRRRPRVVEAAPASAPAEASPRSMTTLTEVPPGWTGFGGPRA